MSREKRQPSSPRARRAMARAGLSPQRVTGTGPNGRIVEADVLRATLAPVESGISRQPLGGMRKTIARRLVEAKQTVPHFYLRRTIAADTLVEFHQARRAVHPCSLNDLLVKAVGMAVHEFPAFRSRIEGDELITFEDSNIGIAVGLDDGVVVPVLLQADRLPLRTLASETKRLVQLAREKRVENSGRGVFSISNLGMFDVEEFTAIVNPPESGILAIGAVRESAVSKGGCVSPAKVITLTLSCDHRVVDGMTAALFLKRVAELLESPALLLTESEVTPPPRVEVVRERGQYDVAVIGSGPGGYVAALQAAELGARVAVIEKSAHLGGTCLNNGCIPSKALLASAELLHRVQSASSLGIRISGEAVADWTAIQSRKDGILKGLRAGIDGLFRNRQVTLVAGFGCLEGPGRIQVQNETGSTPITATSVILAPGSRPAVLGGFKIDGLRVATTDSALHWSTLPSSLLIVGGGVIGVEFACMMQAIGVKVTMVEKQTRLLGELDAEIADSLQRLLIKRGVGIRVGVEVRDFVATDDACCATLSDDTTVTAERTLIAVGRKPNTENLGLDRVGLTVERGYLRVDDNMAAAPGIFCVGDANGRCLLAHAASAQGRVAARNALGVSASIATSIPNAVYTFPEIGCVGMTEAQARELNLSIAVGRFPLRNLGKALASGDPEGFVKVIRHAGNHQLLGVHAIGHSAIEFTSGAVALMHTKSSAEDLASLVFAHPSMGESMGEAAEDSYGKALHLPSRHPSAILQAR